MSTTPLLGSGGQSARRKTLGSMSSTMSMLRTAWFDSNSTSFDGICLMVNADTEEERDALTQRWRDHKVAELNFVGTAGALLAACLSSAGSWPDILADRNDKPWSVRVCLYGGLVFALFAVLVAAQQSMRLHRLSSHRDGLKKIRQSLARREGPDGSRPYQIQVYAWGSSLFFLVASVACMIASITVLVWVSAGRGSDDGLGRDWWDDHSKLAVGFTIILGVSVLGFLASQTALPRPKSGVEG